MRLARLIGLAVAAAALVALTACSTAGGSSGGSTVTITTVGTVPWLAAQDGSGAWQSLTGTSFTVTDGAGRYGVAWECVRASGQASVIVTQQTTAEGTAVTASCQFASTPTTVTLSGTVTNMPANGKAFVSFGGHFAVVTSPNSTFSIAGIPAGVVQTFLAYGVTSSGAPTTMGRSHFSLGANGTATVDLTVGAPVTTVDTLSLASAPPVPESSELIVEVASTSYGVGTIEDSTQASMEYPLVPSSLVQAGDKYLLSADAYGTGLFQATVFVSQTPPATASVQLPSAFSGASGVAVSGAVGTVSWGTVTFAGGSGLTSYGGGVFPTSVSSPSWVAIVTSGWLGSSTSYSFPDFSGTAGWNVSWDFPTGQSADASLLAVHGNISYAQLLAFNQTKSYADLPNGTDLELTSKLVAGTY